ncbi:MAG TPA: hypothetical protein PL183_03845, partial [Aquamicrobium sp.]|nr:hypothetical protein [Aquamicrobium sp.]
SHAYPRSVAAFPGGDADFAAKYWPPVSRVDNVAGDRNLVCACPPVADYGEDAPEPRRAGGAG